MLEFKKVLLVYQALKFINAAVCQDQARWNLNCIFADKDYLVSTCGRRMHLIPNKEEYGIEPGSYRVITCTAKSIIIDLIPEENAGTYPNYDMVVPKLENSGELFDLGYVGAGKISKQENGARLGNVYSQLLRPFHAQAVYSMEYLDDALSNYSGKFNQFQVKQKWVEEVDRDPYQDGYDNCFPILLIDSEEGAKVALMPIRA